MTISELIAMTEARIASLESTKRLSEQVGDIAQVMALNDQIDESNRTLTQLKSIV